MSAGHGKGAVPCKSNAHRALRVTCPRYTGWLNKRGRRACRKPARASLGGEDGGTGRTLQGVQADWPPAATSPKRSKNRGASVHLSRARGTSNLTVYLKNTP